MSTPHDPRQAVGYEARGGKEILRYVSGVIKPGSIALVSDQPGFSKTSQMKALSGRFVLEKVVTVAGDVVCPQANIMRRLPQLVAYVEQRYKLSPTLMVKETLEYEQRVQVCDHRRDGIRHERGVTNKMQKTVVVALLHLAPKVFEVFDEVTILNEGEMMCHGPRKVRFEYLGFKRPPERDVAEYLLDPGTNPPYLSTSTDYRRWRTTRSYYQCQIGKYCFHGRR
ncbi:hypothetical protein F444_23038 [Phytophthora nicotianae P1976]|uniref:Uncharacterized protein n=1 Tax=Phytophthora nicotianae P1976 TaxID=1317066 RepID=A0A080YW23_PHYNI|nr:hypothetical protein F444_23038 [Phytophthora nicotianae P1976]